MGWRTHYQRIPATIVEFVERYPDVLELLGSLTGRRPVLRDVHQLLEEAELDEEILLDYGWLSLPTLRAFVTSPHVAVVKNLIPVLNIDKAGPAIHFLLTGTKENGSPPLRDVFMGGKAVQEPEGDVPPRLLYPSQVHEIAEGLEPMDDSVLAARFDPGRMKALDIYPRIWHEGSEALEYVLDHYRALVAHFQDAAAHGDAVVIHTTL